MEQYRWLLNDCGTEADSQSKETAHADLALNEISLLSVPGRVNTAPKQDGAVSCTGSEYHLEEDNAVSK